MAYQIDIHLPDKVLQRWQQTKDLVNASVQSLTNSAQQVGKSLKETATQATDKAIDSAATTLEQAKDSLSESLQTAEQIKNTTSVALQAAIASSINDWLAQHPLFFRLFQILGWAANHPIISFVILLFMLALIWSIIKAIMRLIETASWSILKVPIKLLQTLIQVSFLSLSKLSSLAVQRITGVQATDNVKVLLTENSQPIYQDKQQRLAEISQRLEAIQKEQKQLLDEAAELIDN
ncbi:hypothetical protein [Calothrix sp. PCC 7507]|uniref:hypothetical protein n=1 Tax=Calothrix sp. PCC 7507 TaxID=99598 RepID=UPI00029EF02B|nr:hypothetical protein [Calothrix sp. PCC 7507]AFY32221.1 hypothetical protein Cal7507_1764 [Calothrix sp. PCC 7507]